MTYISRSHGVLIPGTGFVAGGGFSGITRDLDELVEEDLRRSRLIKPPLIMTNPAGEHAPLTGLVSGVQVKLQWTHAMSNDAKPTARSFSMFPFVFPSSHRPQFAAILAGLHSSRLDAGKVDEWTWDDLANHGLVIDDTISSLGRRWLAGYRAIHRQAARPGVRRARGRSTRARQRAALASTPKASRRAPA